MTYGFKEWALVCDALGDGSQSLILRKGGIAEGRAGFSFAHEEFLLFPTLFHEQLQRLKLPASTPLPAPRPDGQLEIRYRAQVSWTQELTDPSLVAALAPYHVWRDEIVEERFRYDNRCSLSLALVRVFRLSESFVFPDARGYGGCRSWVSLPEVPEEITSLPVLSDEAHQARESELRALLNSRLASVP